MKWLQDMIDAAEAAGEKVPAGVYLVGDREPTQAEIEYGLTLQPLACQCLGIDPPLSDICCLDRQGGF